MAPSTSCPRCGEPTEVVDASLLGKRATGVDRCHARCRRCRIGITNATTSSARTFIRERWQDGLWDPGSEARLDFIRNGKYLHPSGTKLKRFAQERSEDCLTWNVFDTLRQRALLPQALARFAGLDEPEPCAIRFWGHDPDDPDALDRLKHFLISDIGERPPGLSEFDVILSSPRNVVFIEAKFGSENPSQKDHSSWPTYTGVTTAGGEPVFVGAPENLARTGAYQLARNWACGARWASLQPAPSPRFHLVNLVRDGDAEDVEQTLRPHINPAVGRLSRRTWEDLAQAVCPELLPNLRSMTEYFQPAFPKLQP